MNNHLRKWTFSAGVRYQSELWGGGVAAVGGSDDTVYRQSCRVRQRSARFRTGMPRRICNTITAAPTYLYLIRHNRADLDYNTYLLQHNIKEQLKPSIIDSHTSFKTSTQIYWDVMFHSLWLQLNVEDQILLLKSCCMEVMCLRAACRFHAQSQSLILPNGLTVHKSALHKGSLGVLVEPIFEFALGLAKLELDQTEVALLAAVLLMQSGRQYDRLGGNSSSNIDDILKCVLI